MAELHVTPGANRKKKVLGRGSGSGRGKTSGKGHKGQNARSGGGVRLGFEGGQMPLYRRIARRGFSNYPFKKSAIAVGLGEIDKRFTDGDVVSLETLREKNLIKNSECLVKILANGEISKKIKVEGLLVSQGAAEKIRAAGGTVETPESPEAAVAEAEPGNAPASAPESKKKPAGEKAAKAESTVEAENADAAKDTAAPEPDKVEGTDGE